MTTKSSLAIVTLSYRKDFDRCALLCASIDHYNQTQNCKHYLVVDARDRKKFIQLENRNRRIVVLEDLLAVNHLPFASNGWLFRENFSLIRNWIVQQLVKLEIVNHLEEEIIVHVDSDTAFMKPFDLADYIDNQDRVRLYAQHDVLNPVKDQDLYRYNPIARKLLGINNPLYPRTNYISNIVFWRKEIALKLLFALEKHHGVSWKITLSNLDCFSEYVLYGTFAENIHQNGFYVDSSHLTKDYWETKKLDRIELDLFFHNIPKHFIGVMISAKSGTNPRNYYWNVIKTRNQKLVTRN
ncbi:MAG: DUF6492 family protein [Waterburya sp.]